MEYKYNWRDLLKPAPKISQDPGPKISPDTAKDLILFDPWELMFMIMFMVFFTGVVLLLTLKETDTVSMILMMIMSILCLRVAQIQRKRKNINFIQHTKLRSCKITAPRARI